MFVLCLPTDGQSIAIRLAKQIASTTDSLKRAISRFNAHPRDEYEGTVYHLPQSLQWQDVLDSEGLISVELSTYHAEARDTNLINKAIRANNMKQRAEEEIEMVKEDMKRAAKFYCTEHLLLHSQIDALQIVQTRYRNGCVNLLYHRLLQCECTLLQYSKNFEPYISFVYPPCSLISSMHIFNSSVHDRETAPESTCDVYETSSDCESESDGDI